MDYGVMSDQEWEEEPEGEDLSVRRDLYPSLRNDLKQALPIPTWCACPNRSSRGDMQTAWWQQYASLPCLKPDGSMHRRCTKEPCTCR